MYRQYVLWLALFGSFMLLFGLIGIYRGAKKDKEWDGDPKMLVEARKARRATLIMTLVMSISAWIIAGIVYAQKIDLDRLLYPRSFHFYTTSFVLFAGLVSYLSFEWILHKLAKRVEISGVTDPKLLQTYETAKGMRWKFLIAWVLM